MIKLFRLAIFIGFVFQPMSLLAEDVRYDMPVSRYHHNVLGDTPEWGALCVDDQCVALPETRIFEDIAPRRADLDGDGKAEIITVESGVDEGASLVVYGQDLQKLAATPPIGQRHRWLAPIGAADFDSDGKMEIAYIETPHLGKTLKIWEYDGGELRLEFQAGGLTNHAIGENFITSKMRQCPDGRTEILLLSADRSRIQALGFDGSIERAYIGTIAKFSAKNWNEAEQKPCFKMDEN